MGICHYGSTIVWLIVLLILLKCLNSNHNIWTWMNSADRYKDSEGNFSHLYARQCFQACSVLSNCCAWNPLVFSWKRSFRKALGIFALLCVKLWWQTQRELRKHVCVDFCQRSCLNCLYENVSILLPLIHKLRGVYMALQTRLQQIFLCFSLF